MIEIFLLPGRMAVLEKEGVIRTVLGSCVAVAVYDSTTKIAGLNHYLLPKPTRISESNNLKYASYAIPALIYRILELGGEHHNLKAQVYGGGAVVNTLSSDFLIGKSNIQAAFELLEKWGISIESSDVGGIQGRKIEFSAPGFETKVNYINTVREA